MEDHAATNLHLATLRPLHKRVVWHSVNDGDHRVTAVRTESPPGLSAKSQSTFIDEGFGSLDQETLESAMDALLKLQHCQSA